MQTASDAWYGSMVVTSCGCEHLHTVRACSAHVNGNAGSSWVAHEQKIEFITM